jgi:serine/threonine protein kinase
VTLTGRQIGRYRILEQLGSGGMSVVYKGFDTALDREVAVKVLHPHLSQKDESRKRLAREARAVAKLHHPNILEVFDVGADQEDAYLVTELIRGQTLRAFLEREKLDPPELAAMVVHELASALAHAHEAGVIHRDLKPENVMVRDDGVLKLMDFGIAKVLDRDDRMTQTGALVGSPAHMAPEVIEGQEAGPQADVFSLGTILYFLSTGELPFQAPNTTATLKRILDGAYEDPRQRSGAISDGLAEVIARCLSREPSGRYASATDLRDTLAGYLATLGIEQVPAELASFFADPPSYRTALLQRLCDRLLERATEAYRANRQARALGDLNQLLALAPNHEAGQALLERMNRRRRRIARRKRIGATLASLVVAGTGITLAFHAWRYHPNAPPLPASIALVTAPKPQARVAPPSAPPAETVAPRPPAQVAVARRAMGLAAEQLVGRAVPKPVELPVQILVRPYGYVRVDEGARSAEPLAQHLLKLPAGTHRVVVSCELCLDATTTIDVQAGQPNVFHLPATPKPAQVRFDFKPSDAIVTIAGEHRSAAETAQSPFEVRLAPGAPTFQHELTYEIQKPGFKPEHRTVQVPAGRTTTLKGALQPL